MRFTFQWEIYWRITLKWIFRQWISSAQLNCMQFVCCFFYRCFDLRMMTVSSEHWHSFGTNKMASSFKQLEVNWIQLCFCCRSHETYRNIACKITLIKFFAFISEIKPAVVYLILCHCEESLFYTFSVVNCISFANVSKQRCRKCRCECYSNCKW